jgi:capsular polysaccharide transport system permease protein
MRVETKNRPTARLFGIPISAALPVIGRGFRATTLESNGSLVTEKADGESPRVETARAEANGQPQTAADGPPWLVASFATFVIVPIIAASVYLVFFASNQFVSEVRFAVRGSTERLPGTDALGFGAALAYLNSNQEVYAIADYIRSRSAVDEAGKTINLRQVFRANGADWLSRLRDKASGEDLLRYWRTMVTVSTEATSGLVSIEVRAFTREDAVNLAATIRRNSEALVNRLQERPHSDLATRSEAEVRIAREQAAQARAEVARYRNAQASVDPLDTARSLVDNVTELNKELIGLDVELASAKVSMGPNAPNIPNIRARRDSLQEQIQSLERRITSTDAGDRTAATLLVEYDKLEISRTLAEKQVAIAERIFDQVRAEASRHQVYIDVIEGPTTPQSALFPERMHLLTGIAIGATALWCMVLLTIAGIRDHAD